MATNIKVLGSGSQKVRSSLQNIYTKQSVTNSSINNKIEKKQDSAYAGTVLTAYGTMTDAAGDVVLGTTGATGYGAIAGAIVKGIGKTLEAVGSIWTASANKKINRLETYQNELSNYYSALTSNIANYGTQLENRDEVLYQARNSLNSMTNTLNTTYGSQFTSALQNLFYSKNDIYNSVGSIYTGNYKTFNDIGSGEVAGWTEGDMYGQSELTQDMDNYFNNDYQELEASDLNQNLTNRLYSMLVNSDTTFSKQVKGYETELKDYISSALLNTRSTVKEYSEQLQSLNTSEQSDKLDAFQKMGQAAAERAMSGLRGATTTSSEAILKLQQDLTDYTYSLSRASVLGNFKLAIENQQLSISQKIASARSSEQLALQSATEQAISSWNQGVQTATSAEHSANQYLSGAAEYYDEAENDKQEIYKLVNKVQAVK